MEVSIVNVANGDETYNFDVTPDTTIHELMMVIERHSGIAVACQQVSIEGKDFVNSKHAKTTLRDAGVQAENPITVKVLDIGLYFSRNDMRFPKDFNNAARCMSCHEIYGENSPVQLNCSHVICLPCAMAPNNMEGPATRGRGRGRAGRGSALGKTNGHLRCPFCGFITEPRFSLEVNGEPQPFLTGCKAADQYLIDTRCSYKGCTDRASCFCCCGLTRNICVRHFEEHKRDAEHSLDDGIQHDQRPLHDPKLGWRQRCEKHPALFREEFSVPLRDMVCSECAGPTMLCYAHEDPRVERHGKKVVDQRDAELTKMMDFVLTDTRHCIEQRKAVRAALVTTKEQLAVHTRQAIESLNAQLQSGLKFLDEQWQVVDQLWKNRLQGLEECQESIRTIHTQLNCSVFRGLHTVFPLGKEIVLPPVAETKAFTLVAQFSDSVSKFFTFANATNEGILPCTDAKSALYRAPITFKLPNIIVDELEYPTLSAASLNAPAKTTQIVEPSPPRGQTLIASPVRVEQPKIYDQPQYPPHQIPHGQQQYQPQLQRHQSMPPAQNNNNQLSKMDDLTEPSPLRGQTLRASPVRVEQPKIYDQSQYPPYQLPNGQQQYQPQLQRHQSMPPAQNNSNQLSKMDDLTERFFAAQRIRSV